MHRNGRLNDKRKYRYCYLSHLWIVHTTSGSVTCFFNNPQRAVAANCLFFLNQSEREREVSGWYTGGSQATANILILTHAHIHGHSLTHIKTYKTRQCGRILPVASRTLSLLLHTAGEEGGSVGGHLWPGAASHGNCRGPQAPQGGGLDPDTGPAGAWGQGLRGRGDEQGEGGHGAEQKAGCWQVIIDILSISTSELFL